MSDPAKQATDLINWGLGIVQTVATTVIGLAAVLVVLDAVLAYVDIADIPYISHPTGMTAIGLAALIAALRFRG